MTAIVEDGLAEIAYGDWEGLTVDEVKARWPEAYDYWAEDVAEPRDARRRNRVSRRRAGDARRRGDPHAAHRGNVLIVSHKATLRIITCALLGLDVRLFRARTRQAAR